MHKLWKTFRLILKPYFYGFLFLYAIANCLCLCYTISTIKKDENFIMAKTRQKSCKQLDLRKIKHGKNYVREEKLFSSDNGIDEEELAGGVVVDASVLLDGSVSFYVIKTSSGSDGYSLGEIGSRSLSLSGQVSAGLSANW